VSGRKVVIAAADAATSYGWGMEACWQGLLSRRSAISPVRHFDTSAFQSKDAGIITELPLQPGGSRVMAMLTPLLGKAAAAVPPDAVCLLATTIGEIEYLERSAADGGSGAEESCPSRLLLKILAMKGLQKPGAVVSSACASAGVAIAEGAMMIADGEEDCVLVVACDGVSEFIYSGFSSLLALDSGGARPFDRNRGGLSVGEAAGYLLLMNEERALQEGRKIFGEISGWGLSNDAHHMTGPSLNGEGLAKAINQALAGACIEKKEVASISAHGTGTLYNDAMEMKAFKAVFGTARVPTYSIKGAIGHTMAAAGLVEAIIALKSLQEQKIPPTVGPRDIDEEAQGWVSMESAAAPGNYALSTNSGFGGVNSALLLKRGHS